MNRRQRRQAGLTLIEIMLVLVILMMVVGAVVVYLMPRFGEAQVSTTRAKLSQIDTQIQMYSLHIGRAPTEDEGLRALIRRPQFENEALNTRWQGPYLDPDFDFIDPWGNTLRYEPVEGTDAEEDDIGRPYRVFSAGPDGQPDSDDDVYARERREEGEEEPI